MQCFYFPNCLKNYAVELSLQKDKHIIVMFILVLIIINQYSNTDNVWIK